MATETRRIDIKVTTDSQSTLKKIASGFSNLNKSVDRGASSLNKFKNAFLAIQGFNIAGFGISNLVQSLDTVQKLQTRLESLEGSAQAASRTFAGLVQVANANFTSIKDLGLIYNRLGQSLKDTGVSSDGILAVTDLLVKTFRLSGATAAEATASVVQLSQSFASGELRGQELRSVLEQNSEFGRLLSKQLKVGRGDLLKFAEAAGGIKIGDVFKAFSSGAEEVNRAAEKLRPTISEALTKNFNILQEKLSELNNRFEITEKVIKVIDFTFQNLGEILTAGAIVTGIIAINKALGLMIGLPALLAAKWSSFMSLPIVTFFKALGAIILKVGVAIGGLPVVIGVAAAALAGVLIFSKDARDSLVKLGKEGVDYVADKFKTQAERAAEAAEAQKKYQESIKSAPIVGITTAFTDWDKAIQGTLDTIKNGEKILVELEKAGNVVQYATGTKVLFDFRDELAKLNAEYAKTGNLTEYNKELKSLKLQELSKQYKEGAIDLNEYNKRVKEISLGKLVNNVRESSDVLKALNEEFRRTGDIGKFAEGFRKLREARIDADASQGSTDAITAKLEKNKIAVEALNQSYAEGSETLASYNTRLDILKLDDINAQFKAGKISVDEYYQSLSKLEAADITTGFQAGLSQYLQSSGTLASNFASAVENTFNRLEESLFEFIKTGKFEFNKFTQAILDDLLKIAIRQQIIRPLAGALFGPAPGAAAANGAAFDGGRANFFADGGVVSGRTSFLYGGGMKRGVMAEAGPEAILPLQRDSQGKLGVASTPSNVTVNVVNNANNTEIEQRERTDPSGARILDVIIVNKVKEGLSSGFFDKQFESQYGLRRRGV